MDVAIHQAGYLRQDKTMQRYLVTCKRCHLPFKWFTAKTNRLALYSLSLLWFELNFYVVREWNYSALDSNED